MIDVSIRLDVSADKNLPVKSRIINLAPTFQLVFDPSKLILMKYSSRGCHLIYFDAEMIEELDLG